MLEIIRGGGAFSSENIRAINHNFDVLSDVEVNVQSYGAVGNGIADDTLKIQAAFDAVADLPLVNRRGTVYFPAGIYRITFPITVAGFSTFGTTGLRIRGAGRNSAILMADFVSAGTLLWIGSAVADSVQYGVSIDNVGFTDSATSIQTNLLALNYCLDARITNCAFTALRGTMLRIQRPQNVVIFGCELRGKSGSSVDYGIRFEQGAGGGNGQGCRILGTTIKDIQGSGAAIALNNGSEHSVVNGMIESSTVGILVASQRCQIIANSFESSYVGTTSHVQVGNASSANVTATIAFNTMSGGTLPIPYVIDAVKYAGLRILGNAFFTNAFVRLGSDNSNEPSYYMLNTGLASIVTDNASDGKWIFDYTPGGTSTVAWRATASNGATTPSVRGLQQLLTANTDPTTITAFPGGYNGKMIFVEIGDDLTTIADGANIKTATGQNLTPASGDLLLFRATTGSSANATPVWRHVGTIPATKTQAASSGTFTIPSANANNGTATGWYQVAPGIWVPYTTDPTP